MPLQEFIAESMGEWEHVEFKKSTGELHAGMETLCGFLNGTGGRLLFGVTAAGRIQGQDFGDATFQEVANAIRKLEPPARIDQTRIPVAGPKEVLVLQTTEQADGPIAGFLAKADCASGPAPLAGFETPGIPRTWRCGTVVATREK